MPEKRRAMLICLLLAGITLALYQPVTHFAYVNFDDPDYVVYNTHIQNGLNLDLLKWAFQTRHASNWHPITWISLALDWELFGLNPGREHLVNVLFHAANSVLFFLVFWRMTGALWRSALVGALFAWHPLHVQSVAWIAERKDVLSAFFLLLTVAAYVRYVKATGRWRPIMCLTVLLLFALGLLSKPMVMTAPVVLLLLDFWPLQRPLKAGLFLEKVPFLILAAVDGVATIWAQKGANSVVSFEAMPLGARLANVLVSYVLYLWKMIWPVDLAVLYPFSHRWAWWQACGAALLLATITAGTLCRRKAQPWLIVGWLWYLVTLIPVIGLMQTGVQSMADRYTYVPLVGIFIMIAWALPGSWAVWPRPGLVFGAVVTGALLFLMAGTEVQLPYWRNSIALFSHTVAVTDNNIMAEYNLAQALAEQGDQADAIVHYKEALAMKPNSVEARYNSQVQARYNLGLIYRQRKEWAEAEALFRAFTHDEPNTARGHFNLAVALVGAGRVEEAMKEFRTDARLDGNLRGDGQIYLNLAAAYAEAGSFDKAATAAEQARAAALAEGNKDLADKAAARIATFRAAARR